MIAQTTGTPVLAVAAKYVDVASFNDYTIIPELTAPLHNADPTYLPVGDGLAADLPRHVDAVQQHAALHHGDLDGR